MVESLFFLHFDSYEVCLEDDCSAVREWRTKRKMHYATTGGVFAFHVQHLFCLQQIFSKVYLMGRVCALHHFLKLDIFNPTLDRDLKSIDVDWLLRLINSLLGSPLKDQILLFLKISFLLLSISPVKHQ